MLKTTADLKHNNAATKIRPIGRNSYTSMHESSLRVFDRWADRTSRGTRATVDCDVDSVGGNQLADISLQ